LDAEEIDLLPALLRALVEAFVGADTYGDPRNSFATYGVSEGLASGWEEALPQSEFRTIFLTVRGQLLGAGGFEWRAT